MNSPLPLVNRFKAHWRTFLLVHLMFTLLGIAVLSPLFGLILRLVLAQFGSAALADQEIAALLLSPLGLLAAILLGGLLLCITALEMGSLQVIAQASAHSLRVPPVVATRYAVRHAVPMLLLTIGLVLRVLAYLLPLAAILFAVQQWLLADYDINFYLSQRPPQFYYALTIGGVAAIAFIWLLGRQLVRWSLVLPLVLFTPTSPLNAFDESARLTRNQLAQIARALAGWVLLAMLLLLLPAALFSLVTGWVVSIEYHRLSILLLSLGATTITWLLLNFLVAAMNLAGFTLVIASLYERLGPRLSETLVAQGVSADLQAEKAGGAGLRMAIALGVAALLIATGIMLLRGIQTRDDVLVIAHRGAAGAAPENTLAAVRRAIDDGADWVEIDVQETRDGQVVVVHDSDFMKLSGNPLKVWQGDLADIQQIDVGSWFADDFAAERVPTLQQVLELTRGRSKLVIELKYYGHDQQLEQRVVNLVEAANMTDDVAIMSLKLDGVKKLEALRPDWTTGLLAATALGDLSRVDVDFLAVNQNLAKARFIRRAHAAGKKVFVWTLNDALSLSRAMSMGVDGVITDEPALARRVLEERAGLSTGERLLLSAGLLFGQPDVANRYRDDSP